ncbi:MAG: amidohydrolase family protein [Solirubrobacteraceae bacterium]
MKTIGTEEHFVTEEVVAAWSQVAAAPEQSGEALPPGELGERLLEVGRRRIEAMDRVGLDVQVISVTQPALTNLPADMAAGLQVDTNDRIAALVNAHPDRFQGFATLATSAPAAAAQELDRAVTKLGLQGALLCGRTGDRNLDHHDNWPIFEAAAALRAPLYIHPQPPQARVRAALYEGFGGAIDQVFATSGIGWHYESGVQFLRLALAGVFDRFPDLTVLLGHWGEVVLFYLDRADWLAMQAKLPHSFSDYVRRNAYITAGGVYSRRYLGWAIEVVGADRVMFATDYPYRPGPDGGVENFLQSAELDPADQERVAFRNWEALVGAIRR